MVLSRYKVEVKNTSSSIEENYLFQRISVFKHFRRFIKTIFGRHNSKIYAELNNEMNRHINEILKFSVQNIIEATKPPYYLSNN